MIEPTRSRCQAKWSPDHRCITGAELAAERIAAGLGQTQLAVRIGAPRLWVYRAEKAAVVPLAKAERYRKGLK